MVVNCFAEVKWNQAGTQIVLVQPLDHCMIPIDLRVVRGNSSTAQRNMVLPVPGHFDGSLHRRTIGSGEMKLDKLNKLTRLEQIQAAEAHLLLSTYDRNPILFVRGEGVFLIDEQGERYLDLLSGIGVNALGYSHPAIVEAIAKQSRALIHVSNLFYHEGQAELAQRLTERTGLDRIFFANTGTEAWEGALKLARAHAGLLRSEGKQIGTKFLALEQSFHGRTFGSMSTTHKAKYREPFGPVVPGVEFVKFNDIADLRAKFS